MAFRATELSHLSGLERRRNGFIPRASPGLSDLALSGQNRRRTTRPRPRCHVDHAPTLARHLLAAPGCDAVRRCGRVFVGRFSAISAPAVCQGGLRSTGHWSTQPGVHLVGVSHNETSLGARHSGGSCCNAVHGNVCQRAYKLCLHVQVECCATRSPCRITSRCAVAVAADEVLAAAHRCFARIAIFGHALADRNDGRGRARVLCAQKPHVRRTQVYVPRVHMRQCGVAVASVILWSLSVHWLLRLAGVLGCAACLTVAVLWIIAATTTAPLAPVKVTMGAFFFLQSMFLSMWLGLVPLLPTATAPAVDN